LGVSSLDLGRLFIQAALFSWALVFPFLSSFRGARSASFDVQLHIRESIKPHEQAERWIPGSRFARPGMTEETGKRPKKKGPLE